MYSEPFSSAWIFDRCQEGSVLFGSWYFIGVLFVILICSSYLIYKKTFSKYTDKKFSVLLFLYSLLSSFILTILYMITVLFTGYFVFNCAAHSRFWKLVEPAIALNAHLNHLQTYDLELPKSQVQLQQQFPTEYAEMTANSKVRYAYNAETDEYILAVRPSLYNLQVFSNGQRISYKLGWASFFYDDIPYFQDQSKFSQDLMPK